MTTTQAVAPQSITDAPGGKTRRGDKEASVWRWLWTGLSAGLFAVILGLAAVTVIVPQLTGAVPLTILSSSMEPTLPVGTLAVVRPIPQSRLGDIRMGDVISYMPNPNDATLVTHRVIGIDQHQSGGYVFTTQGDANDQADAPVRGKQVRATLWYSIPGLGWVNDFINVQGNRVWIIPTAAGLLFAYMTYMTVSSAVEQAKQKKGTKTDGDATGAAAT